MSILRTWFKSSSPVVKVWMAVAITTGLVVVNNYYYKPYTQRKRRLIAEEWANMIIEKEEAMEQSTETQ